MHAPGLRVNRGLAKPAGLAGRVAAGAGAGCKIPTHDQPTPAARVGPTHGGLPFFGEGWPAGRLLFSPPSGVSADSPIPTVPQVAATPLQVTVVHRFPSLSGSACIMLIAAINRLH